MQELELPAFRSAEHARVRLLNTTSNPHHRLERNLNHLVAADPDIDNLGQDLEILAMLKEHGLEERDVATARIGVGDATFVLLCVSQARWHDPHFAAQHHDIQSDAGELGKRVVIIPEAYVQRQPRFQGTKPVARIAGYPITTRARMRLLAKLAAQGSTSLMNCAALVEDTNPDPVGSILTLVSTGVLWMNLDQSLRLDGLVHLPGHDANATEFAYGGQPDADRSITPPDQEPGVLDCGPPPSVTA